MLMLTFYLMSTPLPAHMVKHDPHRYYQNVIYLLPPPFVFYMYVHLYVMPPPHSAIKA